MITVRPRFFLRTVCRATPFIAVLIIGAAQPLHTAEAAPVAPQAVQLSETLSSRTGRWVSTWGTAQPLTSVDAPVWMKAPPQSDRPSPVPPIPVRLKDQTVRMIIRTSVAGHALRVQLSNAQGMAPVTIGAAHIALSGEGARIVPNSDWALTFGGRASFSIPPGAVIVSDPIDIKVGPLSRMTVSLYVPNETSRLTVHSLGLHTTYVAPGNQTNLISLKNASTNLSYFWLSGIEVWASCEAASLVAFGDSITDGYATSPDIDHAWPALLSESLSSRKRERPIGVVNVGISGNRVLHEGVGTSALARFDRDVLARPGVRWVLFLEGINDISFPAIPGAPAEERISSADLIAGYREFIEKAHLYGIKVIGGTLLPWEGVWTFSQSAEAIRQDVNRWIRSSGSFDRVVDFDAVTRDPQNPTRLRPAFDSGDHVHPNDAGNQAMAAAITSAFFEEPGSSPLDRKSSACQ